MQSSAEKGMQRATDPFRLPPPHTNLLVKLGKPEVSHLDVQLAIPAHMYVHTVEQVTGVPNVAAIRGPGTAAGQRPAAAGQANKTRRGHGGGAAHSRMFVDLMSRCM